MGEHFIATLFCFSRISPDKAPSGRARVGVGVRTRLKGRYSGALKQNSSHITANTGGGTQRSPNSILRPYHFYYIVEKAAQMLTLDTSRARTRQSQQSKAIVDLSLRQAHAYLFFACRRAYQWQPATLYSPGCYIAWRGFQLVFCGG